MKNIKKIKAISVIICVVSLFTVVLAEPGGADDPLVTKSYVETVLIPQITSYIDQKIGSGGSASATSDSFVVVNMKEGQNMICSAGTELILRMGKATVIATEKGGLADTTAGYDIGNANDMPSNHLLIVPVADGRGITAQNDVIVMVKGRYEIK
jgi:hypothetical protein